MNTAVPLPMDVRLMNGLASLLFALAALGAAAAAALWVLRLPVFNIAGITVRGDTVHNSAPMLRANVAPRLAGNFFTLNLATAREAFESVPWVRQAVVMRQFPNRLRVRLQEHQPVALWGSESEPRLVNSFGEVFEANVDELADQDLPRLSGPDGQSQQVLQMYRLLKPVFDPLDLSVQSLALSPRGSWQLGLDNGASVEIGRGEPPEVLARTRRFAQTLTQVAGRYGRHADDLLSADLRHADGYAVRLRGVSTTPDAPAKK
ncbi:MULTISPECIES: cell division protein FtsQ/DivIB [Ramlibacter]|uniref:Cell division protein FtsQ n=1 Tax=Ramlibacter aquaticus TaxID=2780094 RepID=A0ABR9SDT2_9BURK|nr:MULTISPECIES: cell division protein FtsQ/DivIB [Ramlibacter]MBE7940512.1 cell division protein FtsQ/DivIB [Ramlibacter aquaticus]